MSLTRTAGSVTPNDSFVDSEGCHILLSDRFGTVIAETLIDIEDMNIAATVRWCLRRDKRGYVIGNRSRGNARALGRGRRVYLHRIIMDAPEGMEVDHIDGNILNNRRTNLRIVSRCENGQNIIKTQKSGFSNVYPLHGGWRAQVKVGGKSHSSPVVDTIEEAVVHAERLRKEHMPFHNPDRYRSAGPNRRQALCTVDGTHYAPLTGG